jgi:hypothetical protein
MYYSTFRQCHRAYKSAVVENAVVPTATGKSTHSRVPDVVCGGIPFVFPSEIEAASRLRAMESVALASICARYWAVCATSV